MSKYYKNKPYSTFGDIRPYLVFSFIKKNNRASVKLTFEIKILRHLICS